MTNEELLAAINRRFDQNDQRWEQNERRWQQNEARWQQNDVRLAEIQRHSIVLIEAVRGDIEKLREMIGLVDDKVERFRGETIEQFATVNQRLDVLESRGA